MITPNDTKLITVNFKNYFIYLGRERGKRTVHKVGQSVRPCWKRCANTDYLIGVGINIHFPDALERTRKNHLNETERMIVSFFKERFPVEHGHEYFRTKNFKWEQTKELFLAQMISYLDEMGWEYEIFEGWATEGTY
jgi:hypothetical protein